MTALTTGRSREYASWGRQSYILTACAVFQGSAVGMILKGANVGKITKYTATSNLLYLGFVYLGAANRSIDATSADKVCQVDLVPELIGLEWLPNGATPVVGATHLNQLCYFADDNTVVPGTSDLGVAVAGKVLAVDSIKGVLVLPPLMNPAAREVVTPGPVFAFTANDYAPTAIVHGATYSVPATAAASTITLPDAATLPDGLQASFFADGTLNGHTVTVRDAGTANAAIKAAYTASKRFLCTVRVMTGKWVDAFGAVGG